MNMQEVTRLIRALRAEGWSGDDIDDMLLYLEAGNTEYISKAEKNQSNKHLKEGEI